jgi:phenylacetate-coenzyme A ligase PaaK-like adenylate-forming protein
VDNLDTLTVHVEMRPEYFAGADTIDAITDLAKKVSFKLRSVLSINAQVQIRQPGSLERSVGKGKYVIDNRVLR